MPRIPTPPLRLLESRSKKMPSGCVEWIGPRSRYNYGVFSSSIMGRMGAHRASWILHRGVIPDRISVLHSCDNPPCVNPNHLKLGDHHDNMKDRKANGNYCKGSKHFNSKLNEESVSKIYSDSRTDGEIAKEFNIHRTVVLDIRNGKIWQHVTGGIPSSNKPRGPKTRKTK